MLQRLATASVERPSKSRQNVFLEIVITGVGEESYSCGELYEDFLGRGSMEIPHVGVKMEPQYKWTAP